MTHLGLPDQDVVDGRAGGAADGPVGPGRVDRAELVDDGVALPGAAEQEERVVAVVPEVGPQFGHNIGLQVGPRSAHNQQGY